MYKALLKQLAGGFEGNRVVIAKAIRDLQTQYPEAFIGGAVAVLRESEQTQGAKFLLSTLLGRADALDVLCNPANFSVEQSARLVRQAKAIDPLIAVKLAKLAVAKAEADGVRAQMALRALDVLDQTGEIATVLSALLGLTHCKNPDIRSKAAVLIGHETRNPQWADMEDSDDGRARASAIQSLWGLATPAAKDAFRRAVADPRHRVAGAGAVALYLAGDSEGMNAIFSFARHRSADFRITAAWAMGHAANPRFLTPLSRLVTEPDAALRARAIQSMIAIRSRMEKMRQTGVISLFIQKVVRSGGERQIFVTVGGKTSLVNGLDFRNFVVWHGVRLLETFSMEEQTVSNGNQYRIGFDAPTDLRDRLYLELYSDAGTGVAVALEPGYPDELTASGGVTN
ncbi:MAG: hypothetical protein ABL967_12580 [Bryobacteraceae bacterium]